MIKTENRVLVENFSDFYNCKVLAVGENGYSGPSVSQRMTAMMMGYTSHRTEEAVEEGHAVPNTK